MRKSLFSSIFGPSRSGSDRRQPIEAALAPAPRGYPYSRMKSPRAGRNTSTEKSPFHANAPQKPACHDLRRPRPEANRGSRRLMSHYATRSPAPFPMPRKFVHRKHRIQRHGATAANRLPALGGSMRPITHAALLSPSSTATIGDPHDFIRLM